MRGSALAAALIVLAPAALQAADPWRDRPVADVTLLLGEPSKTKKTGDGGQTLTYKLLLLEDEAVPAPDWLVLQLPGVGLVGRPVADGAPELTVDPIAVDASGRPAGGGITETSSVSTGWNVETGEKKTTARGELPRAAIARKITVTFAVGPDGRIRDWSVAGKK